MTPATEKAILPRFLSPERENQLRNGPSPNVLRDREFFRELDAERSISRLLASALQTARLECDDPTRRKIDDVLVKYEGAA